MSFAFQEGTSSCPHLRAILRGHNLDFRFRVLLANLQALYRQVVKRHQEAPASWSTRRWSEMARTCMAYYGWVVHDDCRWGHAACGVSVIFSLLHDQRCEDKENVQYLWREAFRHFHCNKWRLKARRDSRECRDCLYDAAVCARARNWASESRVSFLVLTGSTVSPAALDKMKEGEVASCPVCQDREAQEAPAVVTMQHILCSGLQDRRVSMLGHSIPRMSAIQKRMAWPSGSPADSQVRAWHECVRKMILAKRYCR